MRLLPPRTVGVLLRTDKLQESTVSGKVTNSTLTFIHLRAGKKSFISYEDQENYQIVLACATPAEVLESTESRLLSPSLERQCTARDRTLY